MKNLIFLTLVAGSLILGACNKGSMADYRVKTMTSGKGQTTEFIYSDDHKIATIKLSDSTKVAFVYNGNTITQTVSTPQNPMPRIETLHLSSTGYVDSSSVSGPMGNMVTVNTHDADGYNTSTKEYYAGTLKRVTESSFKDGNEVSRTIKNETNVALGTVFFEYYTDKPNSIAPENQGMKFIGKDSKNLMKKVIQVLAKGDTLGSATFTYRFDDKGRVISKATYDKGVQADSSNISYY